MELSVIIPAYNEQVRLPGTLKRLFDYFYVHYHGDYEVIVVNDGSTDETAHMVKQNAEIYPKLRLLDFPQNRGRGAVVRDAVFASSGKFILETDADGSVGEEAIIDFLKYFALHPEIHVLIGSRNIKGARVLSPQPTHRIALGWGFVLLAHIMFGWRMIDRVNGFKMFRRDAALDIFNHQFDNTFLGEAEIVYVAEKRGWKTQELPINWTDYRGSQVKPLREAWRSIIGMFKILARDKKGLYSKR